MNRLRDVVYGSRLYHMSLRGRFPHGLAYHPENPWIGDTDTANDLFRGTYHLHDETMEMGNQEPWTATGVSDGWRTELHGFQWLRHFQAAGGDAAIRHSRALAARWYRHYGRYDAFVWQPEIIARRLISWCLHSDLLIKNAELKYRSDILRCMAHQMRHLRRTRNLVTGDHDRITVGVALILLSHCLPGYGDLRPKGEAILLPELDRQILADGGHISRNPETLLLILRDLITLKKVQLGVGEPPQPALLNAIDRAVPTIKMLRLGDGGLAMFNGGNDGPPAQVDQTLKRAGNRGKASLSAPYTGYERLAHGHTEIVVDTGGLDGRTPQGHASLLAFEMSHRRERVIVSTGNARPPHPDWQAASATTAAHSTLVLADTNSRSTPEQGGKRRSAEQETARSETPDETILDMQHTGYLDRFGAIHLRQLALRQDGLKLSGTDTIDIGTGGRHERVLPIAIRFHLHPDAQVTMAQGGDTAIIQLKSRRGWRFHVAGAELTLEPDVHLGDGRPRRSQQILLTGDTSRSPTRIHWTLEAMERTDNKTTETQKGMFE